MNVEIVMKEWKVEEKEDKSKTVSGSYEVRMNGNKIASQAFNSGYSSTNIVIPAKLMSKLEGIDEEVKQTIIKNYSN